MTGTRQAEARDRNSVKGLIAAYENEGQIVAAMLVSTRHADYTAPALSLGADDDSDGADPWLEALMQSGRRVCPNCFMALPLVGECGTCS